MAGEPTPHRVGVARTRGFTLRATGMVIALGVLLIGVGLVGLLAVYSSRRPGAGPATLPKPPVVMPPTPVDLSQAGLARSGRARVQFVDKTDPSRVTGYLEWAALQPTSPGRASIETPRAIVYLRDGRAVSITAAQGEIVYPAGRPEQTESGTFEGGVLIALLPFAPEEEGEQRADGAAATTTTDAPAPIAQVFTREIDFNMALGEVLAAGPFRASGPRFELSARGLRIVGDQVNSRLAMTIEQTDYLYLVPQRPMPGASEASGKTARPTRPSTAPAPAASGAETFYHAALAERVRIVRGGFTLDAARLDAWARLVGGSLPPGAMGEPADAPGTAVPKPIVARDATTEETGQPADSPGLKRPALQRSAAIPGEPLVLFNLAGDTSDVIVATWGGPLVISPLDTRPGGLDGQHLLALLTGAKGNEATPPHPDTIDVMGTDDASGGWLKAPTVKYAATSRTISVLGSDVSKGGGVSHPARMGLKSQGEIAVASASLNLATGIGSARGPLVLTDATDTPAKPRRIACDDQADFAISTRGVEGGAPGLGVGNKLRFVAFNGNVHAQDGPAWLKANAARVDFLGKDKPSGPLDGLIERLHAEGNVQGADGDDSSLACETLDVGFEPSPTGREADPTDVLAQGSVKGRRAGWEMETGRLAARMARDERNRLIVQSASAEGGAKVRGRGVEAVAETLRAEVASRVLDLLGPRVTLSRDGGTIAGTQMRLDGFREELTVFGTGTLDYAPLIGADGLPKAASDSMPLRANAAWTRAFTFANVEGRAECVGGVVASIDRTPLEADDLRAERIEFRFTPGTPGSGFDALEGSNSPAPGAQSDSPVTPATPPRRLLHAEAEGDAKAAPGSPPSRARLESRRFAREAAPSAPGTTPAADRPVERLLLAEGERLIADESQGVLRIPGAGRALIDDRRPGDPALAATGTPAAIQPSLPTDLSGARGTTLLTWGPGTTGKPVAPTPPLTVPALAAEASGLVFDRQAGLLTLGSPSRIIYRPAPDQPVLTIDSIRAEARVRTSGSGVSLAPSQGEASLLSATALGNVFVRAQQGTTLTADRLNFDAVTQIAEASAEPSNPGGGGRGRVVLTEPASATPVIARVLRWDVARQRATIVEPAPTAIPR